YGTESLSSDSVFILRSWLESTDGGTVTNTSKFYKRSPRNIVAIADAILLDELPSGNYNLKIELRSRTNDLLTHQIISIQRMNTSIAFDEQKIMTTLAGGTFVDKFNRDQLIDNIRSLRPITQHNEREFADNLL